MRRCFVCVILLCSIASSAFAWSAKEHIQLTRMAAERLMEDPTAPESLKAWLHKLYPEPKTMEQEREWFLTTSIGGAPQDLKGMDFWAVDPDTHSRGEFKEVKIEPFNAPERLNHFIDLELLMKGDGQRKYKHDLSNKPAFEDIPRDPTDKRLLQAGYLQHRVEDVYKRFVTAVKEGRLEEKTGDKDENAVRWAGYLAHYLEDNTQPQHSTMDYQSQSYFSKAGKAPDAHAEVEYKMADDKKDPHMDLRKEFWIQFMQELKQFKDPVADIKDVWEATVRTSLASYNALPLIGLAAMKAGGQGGTPDEPKGAFHAINTEVFFRFVGTMNGEEISVTKMKARQLAWAVSRVANTIKQAWIEAEKK